MDIYEAKRKRKQFLLTLFEMAEGEANRDVQTKDIAARMGIDYDTEASKIGRVLRDEGFVNWGSFNWITLTPQGRSEAEKLMQQIYAEKMRMVLEKIYEMAGTPHTNEVEYYALQRELGMNGSELNPILKDFTDRRGWLGESSDECVCLTPEGVLEVENSRVERKRAGGGGDVYQTNIHGPNYGGIQQGGQGNTQNVTLTHTNNPDFDKAIASIVELIGASNLPAEEKEELQGEVASINKLALKEPNQGTLEKAKLKLDYLKTSLTAVDLAVKAAPYLPALYHFFQSLSQ